MKQLSHLWADIERDYGTVYKLNFMEKINLVRYIPETLFGLILAFTDLRTYQFTHDCGKLILTNHICKILMNKPKSQIDLFCWLEYFLVCSLANSFFVCHSILETQLIIRSCLSTIESERREMMIVLWDISAGCFRTWRSFPASLLKHTDLVLCAHLTWTITEAFLVLLCSASPHFGFW